MMTTKDKNENKVTDACLLLVTVLADFKSSIPVRLQWKNLTRRLQHLTFAKFI